MIGRSVGWALVLLLNASPVIAGHPAVLLDARQATPGVGLELTELPPGKVGAVTYRLHATRIPRDVTFDVWAKNLGQPFRELASGFRLDRRGVLVSAELEGGGPQGLDTMAFGPGPYPRGAAWEVALVSIDRTIRAFARVIPRPIRATDGPCALSLELVSHRGDRFLASGAGFVPGDDVIIESRASGRVSKKQTRVSAEGLLPPDVITHAALGPDYGARYSVKGRSCEVTLEYEWSEGELPTR